MTNPKIIQILQLANQKILGLDLYGSLWILARSEEEDRWREYLPVDRRRLLINDN